MTHITYDLGDVPQTADRPPLLDDAKDPYQNADEFTYSVALPADEAAKGLKDKLEAAGWELNREREWTMTELAAEKEGVHLGGYVRIEEGDHTSVAIYHVGSARAGDFPKLKPTDSLAHLVDETRFQHLLYVSTATIEQIIDFCTREFGQLGWSPYEPIEDRTLDGHVQKRFFRGGTALVVSIADLGDGTMEVMYTSWLFPFDVPVPPNCTKIAMDPIKEHFYFEADADVHAMVELYRTRFGDPNWKLDEVRSRIDVDKPKLVLLRGEANEPSLLEIWKKNDKTAIEFRRVKASQLLKALEQ
jgi:hypothetical protein